MLKRFFCAVLVFALILPLRAKADTLYYETTSRYYITKSLSYETCRQVTDSGFLDVYVMKVPLDDPYISVSPVESKLEYGLKQTTTALLRDNGAIAGINGDFFGMSGNYSIPLGLEIADGLIKSAGSYSNAYGNESATLFIEEDGNPFIDYIKFKLEFFNDGVNYLEIASVNKTADVGYPCAFTSDVIATTHDLDARIKNLGKIVVKNGVIDYVAEKGETVDVPQDGFVVVMNGWFTDNYKHLYHVGQTAELVITPSIDIEKVETAITGAGKIVENGALVGGSGNVTNGRAPRTALGFTEDRKTLILMVTDGRGKSIGATNAEMGELMIKYGAFEAMHLDGGGSSTFAVTPYPNEGLTVLNTPSDGTQRKVINALGVFVNAPQSDVTTVVIKPENKNVIKGHGVKLDVFGVDNYFRRIELDKDKLALFTMDGSGGFVENEFFPNRTGQIIIYASYDKRISSAYIITSDNIAEIVPETKKISTSVGQSAALKLKGRGGEGFELNLDARAVQYEVIPAEIGMVNDGIFKATATGQGMIRCFVENVSAYIPVYVNLMPVQMDALDGELEVNFETYPAGIVGVAQYEGYGEGNTGLKVDYTFKKSGETQAVYAVFKQPPAIDEKAVGLRISAYGNTLDKMRGRVTDADGKTYTIDFVSDSTAKGWVNLFAELPKDAKTPLSLERIYTYATERYAETQNTVYFDNLCYIYEKDFGLGEVVLPENTAYKDGLLTEFDKTPTGEAYDVTVFGPVGYTSSAPPPDFETLRQDAVNSAVRGASVSLYFGSADLSPYTGTKVFSNPAAFRAINANGVYNISLYTVNASLFYTQKAQWGKLKDALADVASAPFVVVQSDVSPLRFTEKEEFSLLHDALVQTYKNGTKVFVVSADNKAEVNYISVKDGIRYINLGRMYLTDGSLNPAYKSMRLRIDGNNVKYSLENIFN